MRELVKKIADILENDLDSVKSSLSTFESYETYILANKIRVKVVDYYLSIEDGCTSNIIYLHGDEKKLILASLEKRSKKIKEIKQEKQKLADEISIDNINRLLGIKDA